MMQWQSPTTHVLHQKANAFVKKLPLRFMLPKIVQSTAVEDIDVEDDQNHSDLELIFIGDTAREYVDEDFDLTTSEEKNFQRNMQTVLDCCC